VLWYRGEGLPCLVAHIDHVYEEQGWSKRPIVYNKEYIWSPKGLAGDDRCGVYACMQLFKCLNVNALFTDGEERGGIGALEACDEARLIATPYFIEVDRRGNGEAVFYNNEEVLMPEFVNVVSKYFKVEKGSFSDISLLGDCFNVASVNLSAGYHSEHREGSEYVYIPSLEYTMGMIPKLIEEFGDKRYELPQVLHTSYYSYSYWRRSRAKSRVSKNDSYLWWYDDYEKPEVEEEVSKESDCPIDCYDCGALDWDRVMGYWCWEIEGAPDPEHPKCLKKILKEVGPWI
jgi:hypothetical protein